MSIHVFAGYSRRFLTSKLPEVLPNMLQRSRSRGIRVLFYMHLMGGGWVSMQDLRKIGAGQWKALSYALPDLVGDMLVDEVHLHRRNGRRYSKYKINNSGRRLLEAVEKHVQLEYNKAVERIEAFKEKYSIGKLEK